MSGPGGRPPPPTGAAPDPAACDPYRGCITCSDEGVPMRVIRIHDPGLAVCEAEDGARQDILTGIVPDVVPGDRLLVHAGTALLRLEAS